MAEKIFPTKGNLIAVKRSLALSQLGFDLLDRKRNVLVMEMMRLIDRTKAIQSDIGLAFEKAFQTMQMADMVTATFADIATAIPIEDDVEIHSRSVMGIELPIVHSTLKQPRLAYGFLLTNAKLDESYIAFWNLKKLLIELAEVESSVYRLATAIKKTKVRANSLQNIVIPQLMETLKFISESLEEKEREEYARLKVIKGRKEKEGA